MLQRQYGVKVLAFIALVIVVAAIVYLIDEIWGPW